MTWQKYMHILFAFINIFECMLLGNDTKIHTICNSLGLGWDAESSGKSISRRGNIQVHTHEPCKDTVLFLLNTHPKKIILLQK